MPSSKTYEMKFQLNASQGSSFSSTFIKAQQELLAMQNEIQALNRTQSDISAYQKQQGAVEATQKKLEVLQQQYDNIQREIQETGEFSSDLENKLLSKQQQIDRTSSSLDQQTSKLQQMDTALQDAGIDTSNLEKESERLGAEMGDLKNKQEEAAESAESFGASSVDATTAAAEALIASGILNMLKDIADAYFDCIAAAGDFGEAMSNVEALSGANMDEMSQLSDMAKELGATTKFTAEESADAMGYMAMAGWDAQQMLSGMDGVLKLAAASGEDLAQVSDIVTDNLSAFGLQASDTARFSDVLAAAATNSNTSVSIMGETFKNCASIAGALGYSVEDVAVAVGLMANAGVKGSVAGTALKNMFNGLLEGVTLTSNAFGEYEFNAVRADGTMKDFGTTISELRGYFSQMTEAERVNNAMTIAGARGYNGLLAILNATDSEYGSLTASIENCSGAAQRMADIKLDNLNGDLTLMNSAFDALKTTIGEEFVPEGRAAISVATDILNSANDFVKANPSLVKGITAFVGVIGTATAAVVAFSAAVRVVKALNIGKIFTGLPGIIALASAALIGGVTSGIAALNEEVEAYTAVLDEHQKATEAYQDSISAIDDEAEHTQSLVAQLRELSSQSQKTAADKERIAAIVAELNQTVPNLNLTYDRETDTLQGLSGSVDEYVESLYEAQKAQENVARMTDLYGSIRETEAALDEATKKLAGLQTQYDGLVSSGGDLTGITMEMDTYRVTVAQLESQLASEREEYDALKESTDAYYSSQEDAATATNDSSTAVDNLIGEMDSLVAKYTEAYDAAYQSISGQYELWDKAESVSATSIGTINSNLESQIAYWQNYNANLASLRERTGDVEGLGDVIASFADGSTESVNAVAGMASATDEDLRTMVANWKKVQEEESSAADGIADLSTDFGNSMDEIGQKVESTIAGMDLSSEAAQAATATLQSYINNVNSMIPAVRSAYAAVAAAAQSGLSNARGTSSRGYPSSKGYASGTSNAERGYKLVGEEGPELVFFQGGETVLNAQQTKAAQEDMQIAAVNYGLIAKAMNAMPVSSFASAPVVGSPSRAGNITVNFNISGNASRETVNELNRYGEEFAERVLAVIRDADDDERRTRL